MRIHRFCFFVRGQSERDRSDLFVRHPLKIGVIGVARWYFIRSVFFSFIIFFRVMTRKKSTFPKVFEITRNCRTPIERVELIAYEERVRHRFCPTVSGKIGKFEILEFYQFS